jgi:hypothetical protein
MNYECWVTQCISNDGNKPVLNSSEEPKRIRKQEQFVYTRIFLILHITIVLPAFYLGVNLVILH